MDSDAWKKSITLEELLTFLNGPDPAFRQLGDFSRCIYYLCESFPNYIGYAFNPDSLSTIVRPHLSNIGSRSFFTGRTAQYFRYMALSPQKHAQNDPDPINIIRAMLLVVLAIQHFRPATSQVPLTVDQAKTINTLLDRWNRDGVNTRNFYQRLTIYKDPAAVASHWLDEIPSEPNLLANKKGGKQRHNALHALLNSFLWITANETPNYKKHAPSCNSARLDDTTDKLITGNALGENPILVTGSLDDLQLDEGPSEGFERQLTVSKPVLSNEEDIGRALDRARAIKGHEQWVNNLFLQSGDNTLLDSETKKAVSLLLEKFRTGFLSKDLPQCEATTATLLVLSTSCSIHYVAELPDLDYFDQKQPDPDSTILDENKEAAEGVSVKRGIHLFRVPDAEKFWKAPDSYPLYKKTSSRVQLQLPWEIHLQLRALRQLYRLNRKYSQGYLFRTPYKKLHEKIIQLALLLRTEEGIPRFTIERLRNVIPFELYRQTQDAAIVQLVTGQTFGLSTAPLHYWQASVSTLQRAYDCVTARFFPPTTQKRNVARYRYRIPTYVGSRLQLADYEIQKFTSRLRKLSAPQTRPRKRLTTWLGNFNHLTRFNAYLFLAATGHRHTFALSEVTTHDFDLNRGLGVLNDKSPGQIQRARLVVLPRLLCQNLAHYLSEVTALAKELQIALKSWNPRTTKTSRNNAVLLIQHLSKVLTGKAPLFVRFDSALQVQTIDNKWLREVIPPEWGDIPLNFLRHRMDTKLREQGINCEMLFHQMGHLLIGIQPFGRTGMITPVHFCMSVRPYLDSYLENDGWGKLRTATTRTSHEISSYTWNCAQSLQQQYKKLVLSERASSKRLIRTRVKRQRKVRGKIYSTVTDILQKNIPGFNPDAPFSKYNLNNEQLQVIIAELLEDKTDNADLLEWHVDMLRSLLKQYQNKYEWQCTLPARLFQPYIEPAPFFKGGFSAVQAYDALRDWSLHEFPRFSEFKRRINKHLKKLTTISKQDYLLFRLSLLMLVTGGYFDTDRLLTTLQGLPSALRLAALPDVIIIPRVIDEDDNNVTETSECLSGICSVAAVAALSEGKESINVPDKVDLSSRLFAILPDALKTNTRKYCWEKLAEIVLIARRFQVSGIEHAIESGEIRQISLPANQLAHFADATLPPPFVGPAAPTKVLRTQLAPYDFGDSRDSKERKDSKKYRLTLTSLLYSEEGRTKYFVTSGKKLHPNTFKRRLLPEINSHIESWITKIEDKAPDIVVSMGRWTLHLLSKQGRMNRVGPLRVSSAHTYVSAISHLIDLIQNQSLDEMSAEDFEEVYLTHLLSKTDSARDATLKAIIRFHQFLVEFYDIEDIDPSELNSFVGARSRLPQAGILTPRQFGISRRQFDQWKDANDNGKEAKYIENRTLQAAKILWTIMYRAGLRVGEGHLLRHCDISHDEDNWHILIQTTSRSRLKSKAAKRVVALHNRLKVDERQDILEWIRHEIQQHGTQHNSKAPLFCTIENRARLLDRSTLSFLMSHAIKWSAASFEARPHWGRKSLVSFNTLACFLSEEDFGALSDVGAFNALNPDSAASLDLLRAAWTGVNTPSNLHIAEVSRSAGHASIRTSIEYYSHLMSLRTQYGMRAAWTELSVGERATIADINTDLYRYHLSHNHLSKDDARQQAELMLSKIHWDPHPLPIGTKKDYSFFLPLPHKSKLTKTVQLADILDICINLQNGIPAKTVAHSHSMSDNLFIPLLEAIANSETHSGYVLVAKDRLLKAYADYTKEPNTTLLFGDLPQPKTRTQKERVKKILPQFDNALINGTAIVNDLAQGFLTGHRLTGTIVNQRAKSGQSSKRNNVAFKGRRVNSVLRIDHTDIALAYVNSLNTCTNLFISVVIQLPMQFDTDHGKQVLELYRRKFSHNLKNLTIETKETLSVPRFLISARLPGEINNLGNTLWVALLLSSITLEWRSLLNTLKEKQKNA